MDLLRRYQQKQGGSEAEVALSVRQEQLVQELRHKVQALELQHAQASAGGALAGEKLERQLAEAQQRLAQKAAENAELERQLKELQRQAGEREVECQELRLQVLRLKEELDQALTSNDHYYEIDNFS